jgi:mycothiol synthase
LRPARLDDAAAVANLWNRRAAARGQAAAYAAADVEHRWATPGFSIETDTQLAWDGQTLSGYCQLSDVKEPHVDLFISLVLDPAIEDADQLSDSLFEWLDRRALASLLRAPDGTRVVLIAGATAEDVRQQEILVRHGFHLDRIFSNLRLDFTGPLPTPLWPQGLAVQTFRLGEDDVKLVQAYRDAFHDHYGYLEQPFETELERWRHWTREPDFDPAFWFLASDSSEVCGFCCSYPESHGDKEVGLVDEFGVRPRWRRRGIGRALLLESFRALHTKGLKAVELTVDSDNRSDALALYAGTGMRIVSQNHTLVKELRAGRNLVAS